LKNLLARDRLENAKKAKEKRKNKSL